MTGKKKKRRLFFLFEEVKEYTYRVDEAWVFESSIGNLSVDGEHYNQERARKSQKSEKLIWKEKGIFFIIGNCGRQNHDHTKMSMS